MRSAKEIKKEETFKRIPLFKNEKNMSNPITATSKGNNKDNMSIGSAESLAPRWVSPGDSNTSTLGPSGATPASPSRSSANNGNKPYSHIHWVGILRDDTMLCEYCNEPNNQKVLQMSRRFLKKNSNTGNAGNTGSDANNSSLLPHKVDWEFKTYAIQSQRRMVHAIQFHIYELVPMIPGARAKLQNLQAQTFLNGETVRIIEYNATTQKYLIRPSIPLPEAQKLATTGMLVVHAKNLVPLNAPTAGNAAYTTYTFAALYDGKQLTQNLACQFIEKILILSENFRQSNSTNNGSTGSSGSNGNVSTSNNTAPTNTEMSLQTSFGPILKSQMELFHLDIENAIQNNTLSIENSLEYSKQIIERNMDIVAQLSNLYAV